MAGQEVLNRFQVTYNCPDNVFVTIRRMRRLLSERAEDDMLRALGLCAHSPGLSPSDRKIILRLSSLLRLAISEDWQQLPIVTFPEQSLRKVCETVHAPDEEQWALACVEAESASRLLQHGATAMRYWVQAWNQELCLPWPSWLHTAGELCSRESHFSLPQETRARTSGEQQ